MKLRMLAIGIVSLSMVGCAAVSLDLQGALSRAQSAQSAGMLTKDDPLVPCLQYFVGVMGTPSTVLQGPFAGVIDFSTDLYIINAQLQGGAAQDALDKMCAPVSLKLLKNAGRRAPGL